VGSNSGSRASRRSSAAAAAMTAVEEDGSSQLSLRAAGSQLAVRSNAAGSQLGSAISWRTPSSIRSSEPSEIARNKIAELQLRIELERVVRLQREMELEAKRKEHLVKEGSSLLGGK